MLSLDLKHLQGSACVLSSLWLITMPVTEEIPNTHWPKLNEYLHALPILPDLFFQVLLLSGQSEGYV